MEGIELIDTWRRQKKWSARRIAHELATHGYICSVRTVSRWLHRWGISRRKDLDPSGENNRHTAPITAAFPGQMIHLDVKKLGKIPDGGGWWAYGRNSTAGRASKRGPGRRVGYTYLHSAVDGFSRLAYTEAHDDESAATTIGFFARAREFFAAHGITRIIRVVTDNGANYRAKDFYRTVPAHASRNQRTRPYTPRHNGKVERYNRLLVDVVLYTSEHARRASLGVWVNHYNYRVILGQQQVPGVASRGYCQGSAAVDSTTICRPSQGWLADGLVTVLAPLRPDSTEG